MKFIDGEKIRIRIAEVVEECNFFYLSEHEGKILHTYIYIYDIGYYAYFDPSFSLPCMNCTRPYEDWILL